MPISADERLASVQRKIERADKHIADLKAAADEFLASQPYAVEVKRDSQTRRLIYYVSRVGPTPTCLATITGDAIQNLRSALDHLAYQLFLVGTSGSAAGGDRIYFPIARDVTTYNSGLPRNVSGVVPAAVAEMSAIEPYKGGKGHKLWVLHELNNIDKHRLLVTVGGSFVAFDAGAHMSALLKKQLGGFAKEIGDQADFSLFLKPADTLCPLKVGDVLFIDAEDAEVNEKMKFAFSVALAEPTAGVTEPLDRLLAELSALVKTTVASFRPYLA